MTKIMGLLLVTNLMCVAHNGCMDDQVPTDAVGRAKALIKCYHDAAERGDKKGKKSSLDVLRRYKKNLEEQHAIYAGAVEAEDEGGDMLISAPNRKEVIELDQAIALVQQELDCIDKKSCCGDAGKSGCKKSAKSVSKKQRCKSGRCGSK